MKDREEVEFVAPTASTIEEYYDAPNLTVIAPFKEKLEALLNKVRFFSSFFLVAIDLECILHVWSVAHLFNRNVLQGSGACSPESLAFKLMET